ncbi:hypothetical protein BaRGS_00025171, partial [Batillaria attramentaria]
MGGLARPDQNLYESLRTQDERNRERQKMSRQRGLSGCFRTPLPENGGLALIPASGYFVCSMGLHTPERARWNTRPITTRTKKLPLQTSPQSQTRPPTTSDPVPTKQASPKGRLKTWQAGGYVAWDRTLKPRFTEGEMAEIQDERDTGPLRAAYDNDGGGGTRIRRLPDSV